MRDKKAIEDYIQEIREGEIDEILIHREEFTEAQIIELAEALKANTSLKSLRISNCKLGDDGTIVLAEALKVNHNINDLSLDICNIGNQGAIALAEALKVNNSIVCLSVGDNPFVHRNGEKAIKAAIKINQSCLSYYNSDHVMMGPNPKGKGLIIMPHEFVTKNNEIFTNRCNQVMAGEIFDKQIISIMLNQLEYKSDGKFKSLTEIEHEVKARLIAQQAKIFADMALEDADLPLPPGVAEIALGFMGGIKPKSGHRMEPKVQPIAREAGEHRDRSAELLCLDWDDTTIQFNAAGEIEFRPGMLQLITNHLANGGKVAFVSFMHQGNEIGEQLVSGGQIVELLNAKLRADGKEANAESILSSNLAVFTAPPPREANGPGKNILIEQAIDYFNLPYLSEAGHKVVFIDDSEYNIKCANDAGYNTLNAPTFRQLGDDHLDAIEQFSHQLELIDRNFATNSYCHHSVRERIDNSVHGGYNNISDPNNYGRFNYDGKKIAKFSEKSTGRGFADSAAKDNQVVSEKGWLETLGSMTGLSGPDNAEIFEDLALAIKNENQVKFREIFDNCSKENQTILVAMQNKHGNSLLHIASMHGDQELIGLVEQAGADPLLTNLHGRTSFDLLEKFKRSNKIEVLDQIKLPDNMLRRKNSVEKNIIKEEFAVAQSKFDCIIKEEIKQFYPKQKLQEVLEQDPGLIDDLKLIKQKLLKPAMDGHIKLDHKEAKRHVDDCLAEHNPRAAAGHMR